MRNAQGLQTFGSGLICGAAGGLAEIAWVVLYALLTGGDAAALARGVTTASGVSALLSAASVQIGIGVHMLIALALGVALALAFNAVRESWPDAANPYAFTLPALAGIWAFNFFIVLPIISPAFVRLVPYAVSLASKLLFGLAAAEVIRRFAPRPQEKTAPSPSFG